jgi:anti-sigma regulatory factor (Ser/Thr protein kinase)
MAFRLRKMRRLHGNGVPMVVSEPLALQVRNTFDAIWPATEAAEKWLARQQISADVSFLVSLAIEELVTNCIKYGYDDSGEHTIRITLSRADQSLTMLVVDDGHAFDPLAAVPPDLSAEIQDRPIGGLGIHMLRELADNIEYERRDNTNRVTLTKRIS